MNCPKCNREGAVELADEVDIGVGIPWCGTEVES